MLSIACGRAQVLTTRYSRRLITMQKVAAFDAASSLAHIGQQREALAALDNIHATVFEARPHRKLTRAERRAAKPAHRGKCL